MNYEMLWKLMADLLIELQRCGETVPKNVIGDLRSAKTMIEILKMNRDRSENMLRAEEYLSNVESYIISTAKKKLGAKYAEKWMKRLNEARLSEETWETGPPVTFIPGLPRDKFWVRIQASRDAPLEKIKRISKERGLEYKIQENGYILIYGEEDEVKDLVKRIAGSLHGK